MSDHIIFSCGQNVILRLLKTVDFVVVVVIAVVVNVIVLALLVATGQIIHFCGQ